MRELKISMVCTDATAKFGPIVFRELSSESFKNMRTMGFNGVELNIKDPSQVDVEAFKQILNLSQIPVTAIGTGRAFAEDGLSFIDPNPDIRKQAIDRIKSHVDFSVLIGKPQIIIGLIRGKIFDEAAIPQATV